MSLLEIQYELFTELKRKWENYNKDGRERKNNPEYYKKHYNNLEELWKKIQFNHDQLCMEISQVDDYFAQKYFDQAKEIYKAYNKAIAAGYSRLTSNPSITFDEEKPACGTSKDQYKETTVSGQPQTSSRQDQHDEEKDTNYEQAHATGTILKQQGNLSKLDESLRKQQANFRAFNRTVAEIDVESLAEKWEFEDALKTLGTRWQAIDSLHLDIDCELNGRDLVYEATFVKYEQQFNKLKKEINRKMWSVSYREQTTPQVDIPNFNGNFDKWISFKDLFMDAIHNNATMPDSQKMQILKTKVRGEPERLIQHLYISSENYASCWKILNNRYDNIKQIFSSHMNILFGLPNIQHNSFTQIKNMHDVSIATLNAIKNLGINIETWDPILVYLLSQKLDSETYSEYQKSLKSPRDLPLLKDLLDFLENQFTNLETTYNKKQLTVPQKSTQHYSQQSNTYFPPNSKKPTHGYKTPNTNESRPVSKSFNVTSFSCPLCKNDHGIYNCKSFLQLADDNKLKTVKKLGICINCLFSHKGNECKSQKTCRKCTGKHNTLLHDALEKTNLTSRDRIASASHVSQENYSEILLATAQVKILGVDGTYYNMRALIDQGSQISLITEHAAQMLGIKRENCSGLIYGVGHQQNNCKGKINITCTSRYNNYTFSAEVIIMNHLIKHLPNITFNKPNWHYLQNINLADPEFYISRPVDILLGADIYPSIILNGIIRGDEITQPMAQQTQLGWILCGNTKTFQCNVVVNNIKDIQQFWELEDITEPENMSVEDYHCITYFQKTTTRTQEGRYEVRLPLKPNISTHLGNSKQKALAQFKNMERKFEKQEHLATVYRLFMDEYLQLQHMSLVDGYSKLECHLPHHGVERAEAATTKYRVVFNASSKTSTGYSLNDLMYKGPNLQQDLQSLLLKWRQYQYAFTADIEKMYRQILVNNEDTPLQRIIWRKSPQESLQSFELKTVTYGTKAAPFLAMMTLKTLAKDERNSFPSAAKVLEESFYMDDLVHGVDTITEGKTLIN